MTEPVFQLEEDGIDDALWLDLIQRASGNGAHWFTANQLYLAHARNKVQVTRYIARRGMWGLVLIVVGLAIWIYALKADWGITLVLGIAVTLIGVGMVGTGVVTRRDPAAREPVQRWLTKWTARREVERLVSEPALGDAGLEYRPDHVTCLLVVEREAIVDLLLRNGAQRELCALVVAESGYPQALTAEARRLLGEQPTLPVIALHDATPAGVGMPSRLRKSTVLPLSERPIVEAGLFPADVTWLAELAPAIPAGHTNQVPLDSLSLEALLIGIRGVQRGELSLQQAIQHSAEKAAEQELVPVKAVEA